MGPDESAAARGEVELDEVLDNEKGPDRVIDGVKAVGHRRRGWVTSGMMRTGSQAMATTSSGPSTASENRWYATPSLATPASLLGAGKSRVTSHKPSTVTQDGRCPLNRRPLDD